MFKGVKTGTTVFRAVDAAEADIIGSTGKFSLQEGGVESKYFAKSLEDAHWYGQRLYANGYSIIKGTVNSSVDASQFWFPHVDIGAFVFPQEVYPILLPLIIMITENRRFDFLAELTLKRSHMLGQGSQPKDDKVNWLFLKMNNHLYSFVYKMSEPLAAQYDKPFEATLAFTMIEEIRHKIELHKEYEVLRGEESVGTVMIRKSTGNL